MTITIERDMMLSYELSIEDILEQLKADIIFQRQHRSYASDRVRIITKVST